MLAQVTAKNVGIPF